MIYIVNVLDTITLFFAMNYFNRSRTFCPKIHDLYRERSWYYYFILCNELLQQIKNVLS